MATPTPTTTAARAETRRALRARRRSLPEADRDARQRAIVRHLLSLRAYRRARRIAIYFRVDGEVDLRALAERARASGKSVYAPVLHGVGLRFAELDARQTLARNRFGIPEPVGGRFARLRDLDLVLTPLVAFDARGNRLGMGKGYYDRSFGFLRLRARWQRPKLIGVGFGFQKLDRLQPQAWDVPLWCAVTDAGVDYF